MTCRLVAVIKAYDGCASSKVCCLYKFKSRGIVMEHKNFRGMYKVVDEVTGCKERRTNVSGLVYFIHLKHENY